MQQVPHLRILDLKKTIPSLTLGIVALALLIFSHFSGQKNITVEKNLISPPQGLQHMLFGYGETTTDLLWIRAIQDFDFCDKPVNKQTCTGNSWLFRMLDVITDISPQFRIPYAAGGLALSVIITDVSGATRIFEKGVAALPQDWTISYRGAYHYLYEEKNKKRAAELLIQSAKTGGPTWLYALAGRLYSDSGELDLAKALLQEMIDNKQDENLIQRLRNKIASMQK
ncbi:MAG: hypothetical protein ACOYOK_07360 [Pseudobdellovibrionaceae bacterium]